MNKTWTAQGDAILRSGWIDENLSAQAISNRLAQAGINKSRCAVLGRASRLKLPKCSGEARAQRLSRALAGNNNRWGGTGGSKPREKPRKVTRVQFVRSLRFEMPRATAVASVNNNGAVGILHRTGCRWPVNEWPRGESHTALFCNSAIAHTDLPYCPAHCRIAYYAP